MSFLRWTRGVSESMLREWPVDRYTFQRTPEDNHPLWVMGHLAVTDVWTAGVLGATGVTVPESFRTLFGQGTSPSADASAYPPVPEVRRVFDETHTALVGWLAGASDDVLMKPLVEKSGGFAADGYDAVAKHAWHEAWHFGQVATLRKALGLPKVIG